MPYNKFDLETLAVEFSLEISEDTSLFPNIQPVEPGDLLKATLEENIPLATAINTEKARGELIIFPILLEVKRRINIPISIFSGKEFNVDIVRGLNGNPDFLISRNREQFFITAPVITLVEAKNQDINSGLGQCGAEMVAAQIYNAKKNNAIDSVFGCVTTGVLWRFLRLENQTLSIDKVEISLEPVERLLGLFSQIIK
ncbi:hypothetical protein DSM106972_075900 [Dulcicalothrix desertica PCC 7102]|uniref:Uncharacterized protein n=1 Tax=Dulcicalothrix desertica PCC 7102 TaxID=232991 RepID=A0A3S1AG57_9CYAN|nr:hypothetical protein [Dulcicalothrix desertica]RUT00142.1 hypothetical protein DSM106972_075900 [Dulcicalothrix desertica PCC 7102]TWH55608.1 hypothetical protein CAL7102_03761 [Dulcicalothrix desertica PCC 7102]